MRLVYTGSGRISVKGVEREVIPGVVVDVPTQWALRLLDESPDSWIRYTDATDLPVAQKRDDVSGGLSNANWLRGD